MASFEEDEKKELQTRIQRVQDATKVVATNQVELAKRLQTELNDEVNAATNELNAIESQCITHIEEELKRLSEVIHYVEESTAKCEQFSQATSGQDQVKALEGLKKTLDKMNSEENCV